MATIDAIDTLIETAYNDVFAGTVDSLTSTEELERQLNVCEAIRTMYLQMPSLETRIAGALIDSVLDRRDELAKLLA